MNPIVRDDFLDPDFEDVIRHLDSDLQVFARVNFYDREFPLNPKRRQLTLAEVEEVFSIIKRFRANKQT